MEDLDAAIGKAVEHAGEDPANAGQTTQTSEEAPSNDNGTPAEDKPAAQGTSKEKAVWDGKLESLDSLPEELREAAKEHAKSVQRYTTRLAQEAAEARKKSEEFEKRYPTDKLSQYDRWLQEQAKPKPNEAPRITQQEWEDALLDTTGDKMNAILERQVQYKVEQAKQAVMAERNKFEKEQQMRRTLEERVTEFAKLNPDFEKLASAGIMMPILKDELEQGGTLETAYARAQKLADSWKSERDAELKALAAKKKDGTMLDGKSHHEEGTKWVNDYEEALDASIEAAIAKRPVRVKIRPKK